ncbi:hypothetical protein [Rhodococcus gannanensis]|uniref:TPR repeat domain-containing protein n=1 Tax=Rhodococcus gannanensis TaxID=1960308 RepID=A0ABW4P2Y8_9NOCA
MNRTDIDSWNPLALSDIARSWTEFGARVEELIDRYVSSVTKVGDNYWEGIAAEAAQNRAQADRSTVVTVVDHIASLAQRAEQGYHEIDAPLRRARAAIAGAEADLFVVSDTLQVTDPAPSEERATALADWQREILESAAATADADRQVRDALAAARDGLRAVFVTAVGLGADQGRSDADALASGDLDPEQRRRLVEAGTLTADQLADLVSGGTTAIPASQMEYLNQVARELDGRSPDEIAKLMESLPPDARTGLANSLQLVSNPDVTTTVAGDSEVPTAGGKDLLPDGIRESLTRDDLVVGGYEFTNSGMISTVELNGVADNQAIAQIAAAADPAYRSGTDLDRALLDVGNQYLEAQIKHERDPNADFSIFTVDGHSNFDPRITEGIFAAVADDKEAVLAKVEGEHGALFVENVLTRDWPDDGKEVSALFAFADGDATITDPADRYDVGKAVLAEKVMESVGQQISTKEMWDSLSNVTGTDNLSVGQLNPEMIRTLAHSMSPYIPDLAGGNSSASTAFDQGGGWNEWNGWEEGKFGGASQVFGLMTTDQAASAEFVSAAWQHQYSFEAGYAAEPESPFANRNLTNAGVVMGLVDKGLYLSTDNAHQNEADQAKAIYDRKSDAFNFWKGIGSIAADPLGITGAAITGLVDAGGDPLKESFIGKEPDPAKPTELDGPGLTASQYRILSSLPQLPGDVIADFPDLIDGDQLRSWEQLQAGQASGGLRADLRTMFSRIGHPSDGHESVMKEAYSLVTLKDG